MRTKPLIVVSLAAFAACAARSRADVVHDGRAPFENVEILGLVDADLRFKTKDARILSRVATELKYIALEDATVSARNLSEAERDADRAKTKEAIALYERVRADEKGWGGAFATMRLAQLHDKRGSFTLAFDAWLALTPNHPKLAQRVVPKKMPAAGSKAAQDALAQIAAAEKNKQPADVAAALAKMRKQIDADAPVRPSEPRAGEQAPRETGGKPAPRAGSMSAAKSSEGVSKARGAIASGNLDEAGKLVAAGRASARKGDMPDWLMVEAEYEMARKAYDRAALAAMRVVALHPDSGQVGAALLMAGQAYEGLGRPSKSVHLYEECTKAKGVPPTVRDEAQSRLAALRKAASS